jgi:hypothetical protein
MGPWKLRNSYIYVVRSKSIKPLVRKNTFIHIEQIYSNLLQSSPLDNAILIPAVPPLLKTLLELVFWNGVQLGRRVLHNVFS